MCCDIQAGTVLRFKLRPIECNVHRAVTAAPKVEEMIVRLAARASLITLIPLLGKAMISQKRLQAVRSIARGPLAKIRADRPAKGFSVRTIDAGHFEIETDLAQLYIISNISSGTTHSLSDARSNVQTRSDQLDGSRGPVQRIAIYANCSNRGSPCRIFRKLLDLATSLCEPRSTFRQRQRARWASPSSLCQIAVLIVAAYQQWRSRGRFDRAACASARRFHHHADDGTHDLKSAIGNNRYANFVNLASVSQGAGN